MSQKELYENIEKSERTVLVSVDTGEFDVELSLEELEELALTAKCEVVGKVTQKRPSYDKATCIGSGRLEELKEFCESSDVDLVIFDVELSATQIRNIEQILGIRVIDRTMLILDIFAMRARSSEGKLQVELAQYKYRLPRLAGMGTALSRQGGGVGTRGPGETKLESDKRHIKNRITALEAELKEMEKRRDLMRKRRKKDRIISVAIVGYTNVGKSTLLNTLTDAGVLAENQLFATLDPTARELKFEDGQSVLLIDTVGLIRRLPHHLVKAFHSTLEEAANADLILHICDCSNPDMLSQAEVTVSLLNDLGCAEIPILKVYNKCDLLSDTSFMHDDDDSVWISAKSGFGLESLLKKIQQKLGMGRLNIKALIPYSQAGLCAKIRDNGVLISENYTDGGIEIEAQIDREIFYLIENYIV